MIPTAVMVPTGLVSIKRKRGRIAGFATATAPGEILYCGTNRVRKKFGQRANGWSFPPAVRELLLQECNGKTALAGKRAGLGGTRTKLFFDFARILTELRPTWFVFENVPGLLSSNQGRDFAELGNAVTVQVAYWIAERIRRWTTQEQLSG